MDKRIQKLTPKGLTIFNEQCEKFKNKTDEILAKVEVSLVTYVTGL